MDTLGQTFKAARERKRISLSQAAAKTRIMIQHLEMMERDDFSKMPAPAYAKGFIRMYAEFLGLDPAPLVQEYVNEHLHKKAASPAAAAKAPAKPSPAEEPHAAGGGGLDAAKAVVARLATPANLKRVATVVVVLLVAWWLVSGISRCARRVGTAGEVAKPPAFKKGVPAVIEEPPEPYLELPASNEGAP